jgi:glycosyltransferase involved in cell wall biosynthesis
MKLSVITPCFNSEKYISETIESVISQHGGFDLEYIIVDGGSTDGSIEIIKEYSKRYNIILISEFDEGMYNAINKGFCLATGDIFSWINSDDKYETGAFQKIINAFEEFPEINWLKGITSYIDENSNVTSVGKCFLYKKKWITNGYYGKYIFFIQQDSVFWRKGLWKRIGEIDKSFKVAGDYWLWIMFSKYARLYSINSVVSYFRKSDGQLSSDMNRYFAEMNKIREQLNLKKKMLLFRLIYNRIKNSIIDEVLLKYLFYYRSKCIFLNEDGSLKIETMYKMMV